MAEEIHSNRFWTDYSTSLHEINPDLSLILGDFGIGSDSALILDYRQSPPRLLRLKWNHDQMEKGNLEGHWVDFDIPFEELATEMRKTKTEPVRPANAAKLRG